MAKVELKELKTLQDWMALTNVRVKPEQRKYTTNLIVSYLQSRHHAVTAYSIHTNDQLIGYVMLIHADNPVQWIIERLTIDHNYQRQGYGYATADQLIDMVYDFENSEMVVARYKPDNEAARQLFQKLKFEEQEKMFRDRNIALLEFEFEEIEGEEDEEELDADEDDVEDDDWDDEEELEDDPDDWDDEDDIDEADDGSDWEVIDDVDDTTTDDDDK